MGIQQDLYHIGGNVTWIANAERGRRRLRGWDGVHDKAERSGAPKGVRGIKAQRQPVECVLGGIRFRCLTLSLEVQKRGSGGLDRRVHDINFGRPEEAKVAVALWYGVW